MRIPMALATAALLFSSCGQDPELPPPPTPESQPRPLAFSDLEPTPDEAAWRDARLASGRPLSVGTIVVTGTFEQTVDGTRSGLDWELARDFARTLGLGIEVTVPDDLTSFFSRNGTIPADVETQTWDYTPDLLQKVDLYIGPFSILPWRERLMTMVPLYPMQNFLAGRKGEEIRSVSQLNGKRLALLKDSMQDSLLKGLSAREGIQVQRVYVSPVTDVFAEVLEHRADYTLDGGLFFAQNRDKIQGLSLSSFPSDPVRVGWAMKKSETALATLVQKYIAKVQVNGAFGQWFEQALGTNFTDYLSLLATSLTQGSNP